MNYGVSWAWPCTINGVAFPVCTTNGQPAAAARAVGSNENPRSAGIIASSTSTTNDGDQSYRGMRSRSSDERRPPQLQRELHLVALLRLRHGKRRAFAPRIPIRPTLKTTAATRPGPQPTSQTPHGRDRDPAVSNAILRTIASNWGVSAILTARSGSKLSVTTGVDNAFSGVSAQRANQVSDDVYGDTQEDAQGRLINYLNRAAFASPTPGTVGTSPRNGFVGPAYWNGVNLALRRLIGLRGTQNLELRIEAFNLLNTFIWGNPTTNLGSDSSVASRDSRATVRSMQFGVKYGF